jgi:hypothetical protein
MQEAMSQPNAIPVIAPLKGMSNLASLKFFMVLSFLPESAP